VRPEQVNKWPNSMTDDDDDDDDDDDVSFKFAAYLRICFN